MTYPAAVVTDFATPVSVSVVTVVLPWTQMHPHWKNALLAVVNLSGTETLTVTMDVSEDGSSPDTDKQQVLTVLPGCQGSFEFDEGMLRTYVRLSANTQGPSYNPALAKWRMKARLG
jgi:hypothetical protein